MAGATDHRGVSLGISSHLLGAGQRPCLRACLHVPGECDGHPRPTDLARSPWQNPYIERLIGTIRRECLDRVLIATPPIRRVVGPADVAALAVHTMSNTALTGATYD